MEDFKQIIKGVLHAFSDKREHICKYKLNKQNSSVSMYLL